MVPVLNECEDLSLDLKERIQTLFPRYRKSDVLINKSGYRVIDDLKILGLAPLAADIIRLKSELRDRNLKFTNWMGDFNIYSEDQEAGKMWENAWILAHSDIRPGTRILDAGGASTIFSFYLASKGCEVSVLDLDWLNTGILKNAAAVSSAMGWKMNVVGGDITSPLPFPDRYFDFVFCICVLEHLTSDQRQKALLNMANCLNPGGLMGLTIDYDNKREGDKGLRFKDRDTIDRDIIIPSGLALYGNHALVDEYDETYFLGALFLKKV